MAEVQGRNSRHRTKGSVCESFDFFHPVKAQITWWRSKLSRYRHHYVEAKSLGHLSMLFGRQYDDYLVTDACVSKNAILNIDLASFNRKMVIFGKFEGIFLTVHRIEMNEIIYSFAESVSRGSNFGILHGFHAACLIHYCYLEVPYKLLH